MATSLWDFYDGEPFMENPHIAMVGNPFKVGSIIERKREGFRKISQRSGGSTTPYKRKKGKKAVARKRGRKGTRRRARRNFPTAGLVVNPRRKRGRRRTYNMKRNKRGVYAHNPRRRRGGRRRARRNPAVLGVTLPPLNMIAWGAGGFIAPPMVESFAYKFLPAEVTGNTLGRYAVKVGAVLALTYLTKAVLGPKEAFPVALGGSLYVVVSAVNEFAPQLIPAATPATGTNAYRSGMIKAYRSGMIGTGINAYSRPGLAGPAPQLAIGPSNLLPTWNLADSGMTNPVFADPRFTFGNNVSR